MNSIRWYKLSFCLVFIFFQCASGMQQLVAEYKRRYPETNLESLEAGLNLLVSKDLSFSQEEALVTDLVERVSKLYTTNPLGVENLIWQHYNKLYPYSQYMLKKWVKRNKQCFYCKATTACAIPCFILGVLIFSCTNFADYLAYFNN